MFDITSPVVNDLGIIQVASGVASLAFESDVTANVTQIHVTSISMSAESSLNTSVVRVTSAVTLVVGTSDMSVTGTRVRLADTALQGASSLTAVGKLRFFGAADLSADLELTNPTSVRVVIASTVSMSAGSNMPTVDSQPIYRLILPTKRYGYSNDRLFGRYTLDSGVSLLITGSTGEEAEYVTQNEIKDADYYFAGGHQYQLNQTEYDAVTTAGFEDLVEVA